MTTSTEGQTPAPLLRRVFGDRGGRIGTPTRPLRQRLRMPLMVAGPAVVAIGAGWWYLTSGRYVETDDAYIQAARTVISADVSGRILSIEVHDNQRVTKGQVLYRIDPTYLQAALNDAKAQLGIARQQGFFRMALFQVLDDRRRFPQGIAVIDDGRDPSPRIEGQELGRLGVAGVRGNDHFLRPLARSRDGSARHRVG